MADLCYSDPFLDDAGPLRWRGGQPAGGARAWATSGRLAQQGGDDPIGDSIELGNGGPDGGRHVFFLVSLGPHTAHTLVGHHFDKKSLEQRDN